MKPRFVFGFTIVVILALCGLGWSAESGVDVIGELARQASDLIRSWENKANFALGLALVIGILGFLTGALQKFDSSSTRVITVIGGIAIGCLTVVSNTLFEHDHRQFRSMAREGHKLLADIKLIRAEFTAATAENQQAMLQDIRGKLHQIYQLEQQTVLATSSAQLVSIVYAAGLPPWVMRPPVDSDNFYFVGIGDSRSYETAKQASKDKALEDAGNYFVSLFEKSAQQSQIDNEAVSRYLLKSTEVRDTHFVYDPATAIYRFYTLLRVNKQIAGADLRLFSVGKSEPVSTVYGEAVQKAQRVPGDYVSRRLNVYADALDTAKSSLAPDQYAKFLEARELRRTKQSDKAIALLLDTVRTRNDFYLGWYNLALAYNDKKDFANAKKAYERAVELEPKQPARDASLYNSYGFFLYSYRKYQEAIPYLKRALDIDPNHPKAANTLQAAQRLARQ